MIFPCYVILNEGPHCHSERRPPIVILNEAKRSEESKAEHQRFLAPLGMT